MENEPLEKNDVAVKKKVGINVFEMGSLGKTTLDLVKPGETEPTGVTIHGYTPDSAEWRALSKKINGKEVTELVIKKNRQSIMLDGDTAEKQKELLISSITDITGMDGWEYSEDNKKALFKDGVTTPDGRKLDFMWIVDAWGEYVGDRENFFVE